MLAKTILLAGCVVLSTAVSPTSASAQRSPGIDAWFCGQFAFMPGVYVTIGCPSLPAPPPVVIVRPAPAPHVIYVRPQPQPPRVIYLQAPPIYREVIIERHDQGKRWFKHEKKHGKGR